MLFANLILSSNDVSLIPVINNVPIANERSSDVSLKYPKPDKQNGLITTVLRRTSTSFAFSELKFGLMIRTMKLLCMDTILYEETEIAMEEVYWFI